MKKVLIISYNFPPKSGISSRRWAKLSKELTKKGVECFILTRDGGYESGFNWEHDIQLLKSKNIFTIKNSYPRFFETPKTIFLLNVLKFIGIKLLKSLWFKIDAAELMHKKLISKAREIINQGVINVIVSGPPHSLLFQASVLKYENPELNLILDYRDSWNDESNYNFLTNIHSFKKKRESILLEYLALSSADKVLLVTDDMRIRLSKLYGQWATKFHTFHNFYDPEDYPQLLNNKTSNRDVVYVGTIKSGRRKAIDLLLEALKNLEKEGIEIDRKFHFYTNDNFIPFFREKGHAELIYKYIRIHEVVDSSQVWKVLENYSFCLSINDPNYSHAFGTKIFDYMALNKLIIHISNGGELYHLLSEQNHFVSTYSRDKLTQLLKRLDSFDLEETKHDFSKFNLQHKIDQLINYLD